MTEQMKPSGIDWIGNIPCSWNTNRIKYLAQLKGRIGWQGLTSDEYTDIGPFLITGVDFSNGSINWENCVHITEERWSEAPEIHIQNGDLLITKDGTVGKVAIVENLQGKASLNSGVLLIKTSDGYNKKFLYWALLSEEFWTWFRLKNAGNSTIVHLYQKDFAEFSYTFPDVTEQQAIASFLDKECAQIDSIATDLEKQIALLQQYKKSLITETVTRGLDKSAPMKDSGVEWIGKIPEHWQKTRIKFEASIIGSGTTPDSGNSMYYDNGEHSWIQSGDLYGKDYIYETEKQLTNLAILECHALNWYTKDFVVVAMYGASVGNVAISKIDSFTNQACCVIKLNEKNDNRYLFYFLKAAQEEMLLKAFGGTQPNISQVIIKNLNFLNVPLLEQIEIADFLDSKCDMINEMLQSKKDQYDILIKHKQSLIYEYITGKKRVKEVQ